MSLTSLLMGKVPRILGALNGNFDSLGSLEESSNRLLIYRKNRGAFGTLCFNHNRLKHINISGIL